MLKKILPPNQITTSTKEQQKQKLVFDDPVVCEKNVEYCITISSDSNQYSVFVAELGKVDLVNNTVVTEQHIVLEFCLVLQMLLLGILIKQWI
jgi:uncharacterized protein YueI